MKADNNLCSVELVFLMKNDGMMKFFLFFSRLYTQAVTILSYIEICASKSNRFKSHTSPIINLCCFVTGCALVWGYS